MLGTVSVSDLMAGDRKIVNVLSYDGVEAVLRDGAVFSSAGYADSMGLVMGHTILEMDEPEHGRYRKLLQQAFTRREMERWEHEIVKPVLNHYIDAFVDRGRADLVHELMFVFPVHVIAIAMGLPEADLPGFYRRAVEITNMATQIERGFAASQWLYNYLEPVVDDCRGRAPGGPDQPAGPRRAGRAAADQRRDHRLLPAAAARRGGDHLPGGQQHDGGAAVGTNAVGCGTGRPVAGDGGGRGSPSVGGAVDRDLSHGGGRFGGGRDRDRGWNGGEHLFGLGQP